MMIGSGESNGHILAACQDRAVRVFSSNSPKSKPKIMKGSSSEDGSLFRMTLDRSGSYYAASCSDKTIGVYNYQTGDLISIDVERRSIHLHVSDEDLAVRRADWVAPKPRFERGFGWMVAQHIEQADKGCDLDFASSEFGQTTPMPDATL